MFVVGTAGHIDHGKSALVLRMTGIDPDRLPEEKKRGMTIDLGFAWARLPSGRDIGIVDVPGHERFVKNMVAGVGGIDAVIFVVAADDGWMPQSDEHFHIIKLLGVKTGLVALTKKDLVEPDFLELQIEDIRDHLRGSFLENCPVIPVSSITGDGFDELQKSLDSLLTENIQRPDIGAARLFIDRRFTIQGIGTVVTGTLLEGKLALDQQVEILPSDMTSRIRNLQTHQEILKEAVPGSRVAVNLVGLEKTQIDRGDAVCSQGSVIPTERIAAEISLLERSRFPLKNGFEISFLLGTAELNGRVYLLETDLLKPGEKSLARIHLKSPVAAKLGDRFILRRISPQDTIGGGVVLDTDVIVGRKNKNRQLNILKMRYDLVPEKIISSELLKGAKASRSKLGRNIPFAISVFERALEQMTQRNEIVISGDDIISRDFLEKFADPTCRIIEQDHQMRPWADGVEIGVLAKKLKLEPDKLPEVLDYLVSSGKVRLDKGFIKLPEHNAQLKPEQKQLKGKLMARLSASPLAAPIKKEFVDEDPTYEVVINFLRDRGEIIELKGGILFTTRDFEKITQDVAAFLGEAKQATAADIKTHLNTSRKYVIPILERLDQLGVTIRKGDFRVSGTS